MSGDPAGRRRSAGCLPARRLIRVLGRRAPRARAAGGTAR
jgi:hypothetical protein